MPQYVAIPLDWLSAKPANLSMGEASAVGVPYLVSWEALVDAADIQSGETLLITGVAGAVGHAATQIAHWMGATVIGADLGDKPSDADMSINTKDKDLDAEVKRLTNNKGVDLVLDAVGGPMFEPALKSLRLGGRQVAITSVGRRRVEFDLIDFYHDLKRLIGVDSMKFSGQDIARHLNQLRAGFEQGRLKPSPVQNWPIARAVEAYQLVERGGSPAKQNSSPLGVGAAQMLDGASARCAHHVQGRTATNDGFPRRDIRLCRGRRRRVSEGLSRRAKHGDLQPWRGAGGLSQGRGRLCGPGRTASARMP